MDPEGIQVVETPDLEQAVREREDKPLPAALPVLPLKEVVAYPDTLTPLAVGQERSVKLIDDVLSGERTLVLVASHGGRELCHSFGRPPGGRGYRARIRKGAPPGPQLAIDPRLQGRFGLACVRGGAAEVAGAVSQANGRRSARER